MNRSGITGQSLKTFRLVLRYRIHLGVLLLALSCLPVQTRQLVIEQTSPPPTAPGSELTIDSPVQQELFRQLARQNQENFRHRVSVPQAVAPIALTLEEGAHPVSPEFPAHEDTVHYLSGQDLAIWGILIFSLLIFAMRKLAPDLASSLPRLLQRETPALATAAALDAIVRQEETELAVFINNFKGAERVFETSGASPLLDSPLQELAVDARAYLATMQSTLQQLAALPGTVAETVARQKRLGEFHAEFGKLGEMIKAIGHSAPDQLVFSLQALVKQMITHTKNQTSSAWRTVGEGLELLDGLLQPENVASPLPRHSIRLLVVDDDLISRNALAYALRRTFDEPDVAADGPAALALAANKTYDVIFLDVQMPGMDGFEVCSKIHTTAANAATPVIFVTILTDYESRAKSVEVGGVDLISKPFLTFEIVAKTLTLVLQDRLRNRTSLERMSESPEPAAKPAPNALKEKKVPAPLAAPKPSATKEVVKDPVGIEKMDAVEPSEDRPFEPINPAMLTALAGHISTNLVALQEAFATLLDDSGKVQVDQLTEFYLLLHSLALNITITDNRPAIELSTAIENLVKKLMDQPARQTDSVMLTLKSALETLASLCQSSLQGAIAKPSVSVLVIDPDPVSRRVALGALQTVFEKPVGESDVDVACRLASERHFDVIFLPLLMPGLDGYELARKIRGAEANRETPMVLLVAHADFQSHVRSSQVNDLEMIARPFLPVELNLKTLTLALQPAPALELAGA